MVETSDSEVICMPKKDYSGYCYCYICTHKRICSLYVNMLQSH